jgi:hypothetical protein
VRRRPLIVGFASGLVLPAVAAGQGSARARIGYLAASDLPVERSQRFELVLNRRTARALRFELPASLLVRADRLID